MSTTTTDNDYLICGEYKEQIGKKNADYPGFISFEHENTNHYFAWVNNDEIVLRSEAYPDAEKMERGIKAILKNCDLPERYSIIEEHGAHILVLWGGGDNSKHTGNMAGHNEIGRSCPKGTREELNELLQFKGKDFADKVVPLAAKKEDSSAATATAAAAGAATSAEATKVAENVTEAATSTASNTAAAATAAAASVATAATASAHKAGDAAKATAEKASAAVNTGTGAVTGAAEAASGGGMGWLKWLLPLLLLGGLLLWWKGCNKGEADASATAGTEVNAAAGSDTSTQTVTTGADTNTANAATGATATTGAIAASGADTTKATAAAKVEESTKVKLADGVEINANKGGIEDKLVAFLNNKSAKFDSADKKNNWYDFDNLNFDLGRTTITKESKVQIDNLTAILKAYPDLKIKVGGYTDKKGNDQSNKTLSQGRADAVVAALKANGANASQITGAEGYGEEFAKVAESASDEERRKDRRTAVRIVNR
jgi:outer membrane protein OmpA-like peptidoglycan-associated protein